MNLTNITNSKLLINFTNCSNLSYIKNFTNSSKCTETNENDLSVYALIIFILISLIIITIVFFTFIGIIQDQIETRYQDNYYNNSYTDNVYYEQESTIIEIDSNDYNSYLEILKNSNCIDTKKDCSICLENNLDLNFKKLKCGHEFHEPCIDLWLKRKNTCPLCNQVNN